LAPVFLTISYSAVVSAQTDNNKLTQLGWIEPVLILKDQIELKAKLDSGAKTPSLDAIDIEYFNWNGKTWVRFTLTDPVLDMPLTLERPLVRDVSIKRHNTETQRRH